MAFTEGLNPDVVKTGLDEVFYSPFNAKIGPNYADIDQEDVFRQDNASNSAIVTQILADAGMWDQKAETADVAEGTIMSGDKRTFTVVTFAQALKPSKEMFDDEEWSVVKEMVNKMSRKAYLTQKKNGFAVYRGAFATTKTNDGKYLVANDHANINGDTIDNMLTAALTPTALKSAIQMLVEQKDEAGDNVGYQGRCLLVPTPLYDYAVEITESKLKPDFSDNNVNAFSAKYNLYVKQSNWLNATNGGSDTAWFLLAAEHTVKRWVRENITTSIVDYKYDDKDRYVYKGRFREVYGAISYEGIVGSNGTT
jgi:phage major head subunit gpT-like protein